VPDGRLLSTNETWSKGVKEELESTGIHHSYTRHFARDCGLTQKTSCQRRC
jgi:hypothetical protein